MNRQELGERLLQWHDSQSDPIYAVGSFYYTNRIYPKQTVVEKALAAMKGNVDKYKTMLENIKPAQKTLFSAEQSDAMKNFTGMIADSVKQDLADMTALVGELERFLREDYLQ